ncbi:molybdopterin converting factor subunit 1 [Sphingomonas baiyangensis]|uniref:Molybdopterin converting factor subunit 1 n=1 Tax=Sphingomonas baiyangensis TaxID=2572576 RepID=A0A4U1L1F4_9SPHN|nr:molybdopterin converting factor subunit 1 [Sphingomonas baiyangensis]TKD50639.1 molybdopterin converting factor subunit 1 [Sphingomonas baiyangensis]
MALTILYFAWVRERVGLAEERLTPPDDIGTVAQLIGWLAQRSPGHAAAFGEPERLRAAVDQQFRPLEATISGASEVAIFPPVTGG